MSFEIELTLEAEVDIERHKKSGDKKALLKFDNLVSLIKSRLK